MRRRVLAAAIGLLSLTTSVEAATPIASCGSVVGQGQEGQLVADLDCTGSSGFGVAMDDHSTLHLNGHSITASDLSYGIGLNPGRMRIEGPGEIIGGYGAILGAANRLNIRDVDIHGGRLGIDIPFGKVAADHLTATVDLFAVRVARLRARSVSVRAINGNAVLVDRSFRGEDVTVTDSHTGIQSLGRVSAKRLTATGNVAMGVFALGRVKIVDSVVSGNTFIGAPADIASAYPPRVVNTTCVRSVQLDPDGVMLSGGWDVCAGD